MKKWCPNSSSFCSSNCQNATVAFHKWSFFFFSLLFHFHDFFLSLHFFFFSFFVLLFSLFSIFSSQISPLLCWRSNLAWWLTVSAWLSVGFSKGWSAWAGCLHRSRSRLGFLRPWSEPGVVEPWFFRSQHGVILARSQVLFSLFLLCLSGLSVYWWGVVYWWLLELLRCFAWVLVGLMFCLSWLSIGGSDVLLELLRCSLLMITWLFVCGFSVWVEHVGGWVLLMKL